MSWYNINVRWLIAGVVELLITAYQLVEGDSIVAVIPLVCLAAYFFTLAFFWSARHLKIVHIIYGLIAVLGCALFAWYGFSILVALAGLVAVVCFAAAVHYHRKEAEE